MFFLKPETAKNKKSHRAAESQSRSVTSKLCVFASLSSWFKSQKPIALVKKKRDAPNSANCDKSLLFLDFGL